MKLTKILMGMTIAVEIVDAGVILTDLEDIFKYFVWVEEKFSMFKPDSEISRINRGEIGSEGYSPEMKEVFSLSEKTKRETDGYFDIMTPGGKYNPSGLVKGWAISKAAELIRKKGFENFYVNAGGDIEVSGNNKEGRPWAVGIRNPFNVDQNVKILYLKNKGVATSGIYLRGQHIYDPHRLSEEIERIASLTVIGPNAFEADRFATAAFAMGEAGIVWLENLSGFDGYLIDKTGQATFTSGFNKYTETAND